MLNCFFETLVIQVMANEHDKIDQHSHRVMTVFISQYLPWGENRPFNDASYNCLRFKSWMKDIGRPHFQIENVEVRDEV